MRLFNKLLTLSVLPLLVCCSPQEEVQKNSTNTVNLDNLVTTNNNIVENSSNDGVLNPNAAPSENFDLSNWYVSIPVDKGNGTATNISTSELNNKYQNPNFFYTGADGGMVFKNYIKGYKTSVNTTYTRTELREMLRGSNTSISHKGVTKNNWVFGSAPQSEIDAAGGYDGKMTATLAINNVTSTGSTGQVGRVVIGQIHANHDEPIRLYYRKLPNNTNGSIYYAHEPRHGDEQWVELIGSKSSSANNPVDGIPLNQKFTYSIEVVENLLTVIISQQGKEDIVSTTDMTYSGYNEVGQYMYFKAGIYTQNKTGDAKDYDQVTFYKLETSHSKK